MNQKHAVYSATVNVLTDADIQFEDGMDIKPIMNDQLRAKIMAVLCAGFKAGDIDFKDTPANNEKLRDDAKLNSYVSGLVNNWFRKDKRFNGNTVYKAKNPGSRTGQQDPTVRALRNLLKTELTPEQSARVQEELDERVAEIKASKAQSVEVIFSDLPEGLADELGIN